MVRFLKRGAPQEEPRLQDIADELARIRNLLETHCKEHADLPHQVWERILAEVNDAARDATTAVWITGISRTRKAINETFPVCS